MQHLLKNLITLISLTYRLIKDVNTLDDVKRLPYKIMYNWEFIKHEKQ